MAEMWHFKEDDLISMEDIVAYLPRLVVEKVEVKQMENPFGSVRQVEHYHNWKQEQYKRLANVALVRAQKL